MTANFSTPHPRRLVVNSLKISISAQPGMPILNSFDTSDSRHKKKKRDWIISITEAKPSKNVEPWSVAHLCYHILEIPPLSSC